MGNVIDFMKYKQARDEVIEESMKEEIIDFLLNVDSYEPSSFTYTITLEDTDD